MMYEGLIEQLRETSTGFGELDNVSALLIEAADAIEELMDTAQAQGKALKECARQFAKQWIAISEREPEPWSPVLGLIPIRSLQRPPIQQVLWYTGDGRWKGTWEGDLIKSEVTHWMPLPEPPAEPPMEGE